MANLNVNVLFNPSELNFGTMLSKSFDELCLIHFWLLNLHPSYQCKYQNYRKAASKLSKFKLVGYIARAYNQRKIEGYIN